MSPINIKSSLCILFFSFALLTTGFYSAVHAQDIIRTSEPDHKQDPRWVYPLALLRMALSKTETEYGSYKIVVKGKMSRDRTLSQLTSGAINISWAPTSKQWEEKLLTVYLPLMKGLMGYRLLLINHNRQEEFSSIETIDQLKRLRAGVHAQWNITKALHHHHFSLVKGHNYQGLFAMLAYKRFDYFPRGINEIFNEYQTFSPAHPSISIESSKALYLALPLYFFVSPQEPRLADRIRDGLLAMYQDGSFGELFDHYNAAYIHNAKLSEREIFYLENPFIPPHPIYKQSEFWLNLDDFK